MEDAIERLAEHVVNTNLSDIPNKAIQSAKTYILDTCLLYTSPSPRD